MKRPFKFLPAVALCLMATVGSTAERIEIVIDNSADMRQLLGRDTPKFVALREALLDFAAASVFGNPDLEIGVWLIGGDGGGASTDGCSGDGAIQVTRALDTAALQSILPEIRPGGPRALSRALATVSGGKTPPSTIVLITSGGDQCHQDVVRTAEVFLNSEPPVELRIVGLGFEREMIDAANRLAPTRNVGDPGKLPAALGWALGANPDQNPRAADFEFALGRQGLGLEGFEAELTNSKSGKKTFILVEDGAIRSRLVPGRYRASIPFEAGNPVELSGLVTTSTGTDIEIVLSPPVTLEVSAPEPARGEPLFVYFWGAPDGANWISLAAKDSPLGFYSARVEAHGENSEVELPPYTAGGEMEIRFLHEPSFGVYQLLGRLPLELPLGATRFNAPETVENGTEFELDWTGPNLPADRISIGRTQDEETEHSICIFAASGGPQTLVAPQSSGDYIIRYHTGTGETLTSARLDVYEVLATLDGPSRAGPNREVEVVWTGPDEAHDFVSLADPKAAGHEYVDWSPTESGNPSRLRTPEEEGDYELRYVRGETAEILARESLVVVSTPVKIEVPDEVDAGTRFPVRLSGTPSSRDVIALAEVGADLRSHLDWTYVTAEGEITLAAPFDPGEYEIRYITGGSRDIVIRIPISVR